MVVSPLWFILIQKTIGKLSNGNFLWFNPTISKKLSHFRPSAKTASLHLSTCVCDEAITVGIKGDDPSTDPGEDVVEVGQRNTQDLLLCKFHTFWPILDRLNWIGWFYDFGMILVLPFLMEKFDGKITGFGYVGVNFWFWYIWYLELRDR